MYGSGEGVAEMTVAERIGRFVERSAWAQGLLEKSTPGIFVALLTSLVAAGGAGYKVFNLDKPIAEWLSHAVTIDPATKAVVGLKLWFVAVLVLSATVVAALLLMAIWTVKRHFVLSSDQIALREVMAAVRQIRDQAKQTKIKAWDEISFIYLINKDFSGSQIKLATIRAIDVPVHFWESVVTVEDAADPTDSLAKINYRVRDLEAPQSNVVYLPSENGRRSKRACLFFLPPIQPGQRRILETSFQWPGMFKHLKSGPEEIDFTTKTRETLSRYRVEVYLEEGTGYGLQCDITGAQHSTQSLLPATRNVLGWKGNGFIYQVTDVPAGDLRFVLTATLTN